MAVDHAPDGIRINCVCPGSIETPLLEQYRQSGGMPIAEAIEQDRLAHPMQRIGAAADEVARAALFLSCDDSSFTTGSALFVDGGYAAQ